MIRRNLDLILLFLLEIAVVILRFAGDEGGILTKVFGAVFVLFAPGYAILAAVFKEGVLEFPAKIALGIGISMAISAVGGIGLYGMHVLLTQTSWTVFLALIILIGCIVAVVQRSYDSTYIPDYITRKIAFSELLLLIFSVLAIASGIYVAWLAEQNQVYVPFTELWVISQTDDLLEVEIGIHNQEQASKVYDVSIRINGREVETWKDIAVQNDQQWSKSFTLPQKVTTNEIVAIYLYKDEDSTKPYRWVQLHR